MAAEQVAADMSWEAVNRAALEERFRTLVEEHGRALARLAASYTRSAADRDDLVQEIVMALWQALPAFRGECSERTFLFRIAHNRCLSQLARRRPVVALDAEEVDVVDQQPTVEVTISAEQERERLLRAVQRLPLGYRQAVTLMLEGLSYREIAEVLGIGESNVGVRLNRARHLLRSLMERP